MSQGNPTLDPLPYHRALVEYLKAEERALWDWFAAARVRRGSTPALIDRGPGFSEAEACGRAARA